MRKVIALGVGAVAATLALAPAGAQAATRCYSSHETVRVSLGAICADARAVMRVRSVRRVDRTTVMAYTRGTWWYGYTDSNNMEHLTWRDRGGKRVDVTWFLS